MKKFASYIVLLALIGPAAASAEERASLNSQEYDCRQKIRDCLATDGDERMKCYESPALSKTCDSSPFHHLLSLRADAQSELSDKECLAKIDGELSGFLTRDSFSAQELKGMEQKLSLCRKNTTDEVLKP